MINLAVQSGMNEKEYGPVIQVLVNRQAYFRSVLALMNSSSSRKRQHEGFFDEKKAKCRKTALDTSDLPDPIDKPQDFEY